MLKPSPSALENKNATDGPLPGPSVSMFRRLWPFFRPYRWQIALGLLLLLFATPMGAFHPLVWKYIVDATTTKSPQLYRKVEYFWVGHA